jgi:hypothetical protein
MYSSKYLKYKNKYLNLKQFGGAKLNLVEHTYTIDSNDYCIDDNKSKEYVLKLLQKYDNKYPELLIKDGGPNKLYKSNDEIVSLIVDDNAWNTRVNENQCNNEKCDCNNIQPIKKKEINNLVHTFLCNNFASKINKIIDCLDDK